MKREMREMMEKMIDEKYEMRSISIQKINHIRFEIQ